MTVTAVGAIEVRRLSRLFGATAALSDVSLSVPPGTIHALLGPNGAGKTTLLRILSGLTRPTGGTASVLGRDIRHQTVEMRRLVGVIPSGDRTFYQRLSGLENLIFFARLYGFDKRSAAGRAKQAMEAVGLAGKENLAIGKYSQGMQKRLAIARALVIDPVVLLVDEATHNLDPEGARQVRALIRSAADRGTGVLWATQRVEEIRGFADSMTLLNRGAVRFTGTPAQFVVQAAPRTFLLRISDGVLASADLLPRLETVLAGRGLLSADRGGDGEHFVLTLSDGVTLGEAITALTTASFRVLSCHETRSEIEQAFVLMTREGSP